MSDWRETSDYIFPATLPPRRWAWEFLRRNPDYRKDWKAALQRFHSGIDEFEDYTEDARSDDHDDPNFYLFVEEQKKWRLAALLNPATPEPIHLGFDLDFGTVRFMKEGASFTARGPAYPIVEFNLNQVIKPQLETIEGALRRQQVRLAIKPRKTRNRRKLWSHYLRLLDAALDGRSPKHIADALAGEQDGLDEKKVWDRLRAARRMMRPDGYMSIFLSTP